MPVPWCDPEGTQRTDDSVKDSGYRGRAAQDGLSLPGEVTGEALPALGCRPPSGGATGKDPSPPGSARGGWPVVSGLGWLV